MRCTHAYLFILVIVCGPIGSEISWWSMACAEAPGRIEQGCHFTRHTPFTTYTTVFVSVPLLGWDGNLILDHLRTFVEG